MYAPVSGCMKTQEEEIPHSSLKRMWHRKKLQVPCKNEEKWNSRMVADSVSHALCKMILEEEDILNIAPPTNSDSHKYAKNVCKYE